MVIAIFGIHAFLETPIEAYPDATNTQVTVISLMPGYAPEEVERQVTVPLERVLNGTPEPPADTMSCALPRKFKA